MKISKYTSIVFLFALCFNINIYAHDTTISNHWNGNEYNENSQCQSDWAERFFFKKYTFSGNESVLDIGCGDGKLTARVAKLVPHGSAIGIDKSESMVDEANKRFANIPNLTFSTQDAQNSPFYNTHSGKFDLIVSFSTLHWVNDQALVLQGIHHALKQNGKFYLKLSSKGGDPIQEIADLLKSDSKYNKYFKNFHDPITRYNVTEYQKLLKKANLNLQSIEDVEEKDKINGKINLTKQIKSWLPHYHYLKQSFPEIAEQYINEVINTYLKQHPATEDGVITLHDHYLEVVGYKRDKS